MEQDLNLPRPIVAGGTGATSAHDARVNLGADVGSLSQVVTNYDMQVWESGSFLSNAGATSEPVAGHNFTGTCQLLTGDATYITIKAYDWSTGLYYQRDKSAGSWGAWKQLSGAVTDMDARYVNTTGDTMTGGLTVTHAQPQVTLNKTTGTNNNFVIGQNNGSNRWGISLGDTAAEGGGNVGSNFTLYRFDNSGNFAGTPLTIARTDGAATFGNNINASGNIAAGGNLQTASGVCYFIDGAHYIQWLSSNNNWYFQGGALFNFSATISAPSMQLNSTNYITSDGTNTYIRSNGQVRLETSAGSNFGSFDSSGLTMSVGGISTPGAITATGAIFSNASLATYGTISANGTVMAGAGSPTVGTFYFGSSGANRISCDGTNFNVYSPTGGVFNFIGGNFYGGSGYYGRAGHDGAYGSSVYNLYYAAGLTQLWIDSTNYGNISVSSDYRIKKDVEDLPGMWDTVKALRPIKYTQAQFSPPSHVEYVEGLKEQASKTKKGVQPVAIPGHLFEEDDVERWGFIAHELQETLTPSAATSVKDADDAIQSPNPFTVIAALTKALQEAMTRIEALEARR